MFQGCHLGILCVSDEDRHGVQGFLSSPLPLCPLLGEEKQGHTLLVLPFAINCISCWCGGHPIIHFPRGICDRP